MALPRLLLLLGAAWLQHGVEAKSEPEFVASKLYDLALDGAYAWQSYQSFGGNSPKLITTKQDERCHDGLVFLEPRGLHADRSGPVVVDNDGNLVWMPAAWSEATDVKVQQFNGKSYMTFWNGTDGNNMGEGAYIMVSTCSSSVAE